MRLPLISLSLVAALLGPLPAVAAGGLKTIDNPGGGEAVYGPVLGSTSLGTAMVVVLRDVHQYFGAKPEIGKFFSPRSGDSVATFFTVASPKADGEKFSGLVMVSMPAGAHPAAAVIFDEASRFHTTARVLLQKLDAAWHGEAAKAASLRRATSASASPSAETTLRPALPLTTQSVADGSASIGLPEGWSVIGGGGGQIHVAGPHHESINLGVLIQGIYDPNDSRARGLIQYARMSGRQPFLYPYGADLVAGWIAVIDQYHEHNGTPLPTFEVTKHGETQPSRYEAGAELVEGTFDEHAGDGPLLTGLRVGALRSNGSGMWAMTVTRISYPANLQSEEKLTIAAIERSYRQNGRVISQETAAVIGQIHARARANQARIDAQTQADDEHNASVEAGWDQSARYNKSFENYTLDQSIVTDSDSGEHSTYEKSAADAMVRANPGRYQITQQQDYVKGQDF